MQAYNPTLQRRGRRITKFNTTLTYIQVQASQCSLETLSQNRNQNHLGLGVHTHHPSIWEVETKDQMIRVVFDLQPVQGQSVSKTCLFSHSIHPSLGSNLCICSGMPWSWKQALQTISTCLFSQHDIVSVPPHCFIFNNSFSVCIIYLTIQPPFSVKTGQPILLIAIQEVHEYHRVFHNFTAY